MPDIQLRFHKDMLVLSAPVDAALASRGFDDLGERELLLVSEPETIVEPLRLNMIAGAQCLVLPCAGITRARLAHMRSEDRAKDIAEAALGIASQLVYQHLLVEIGPTGLPLDVTSKTSLSANRDQYADAVRLFSADRIDAFFLNDMAGVDDLRCALMGVRKVSDAMVFASVASDEFGTLRTGRQSIESALAVMEEYGAQVAGVSLDCAPEAAARIVERMAAATDLPLLVQLDVPKVHARDPHDGSAYWCADLVMPAAATLRASGAQFLRACGNATAAYAGALAAATAGLDCLR